MYSIALKRPRNAVLLLAVALPLQPYFLRGLARSDCAAAEIREKPDH